MATTYFSTGDEKMFRHHVAEHLGGQASDTFEEPGEFQATAYDGPRYPATQILQGWIPDVVERFPGVPFQMSATCEDGVVGTRYVVDADGQVREFAEVDGEVALTETEAATILRNQPDPTAALAALAEAFALDPAEHRYAQLCAQCHLFVAKSAAGIVEHVGLLDEQDATLAANHRATASGQHKSLAAWLHHGPYPVRARLSGRLDQILSQPALDPAQASSGRCTHCTHPDGPHDAVAVITVDNEHGTIGHRTVLTASWLALDGPALLTKAVGGGPGVHG